MVGATLALPSNSQLPQPVDQFNSGQNSYIIFLWYIFGTKYKVWELFKGNRNKRKIWPGAISAALMLEHWMQRASTVSCCSFMFSFFLINLFSQWMGSQQRVVAVSAGECNNMDVNFKSKLNTLWIRFFWTASKQTENRLHSDNSPWLSQTQVQVDVTKVSFEQSANRLHTSHEYSREHEQ